MKIHFNSFLIMISSDFIGMVLICYFSFSFQVTFKSGNKAVHPCFYKHSLIFPKQYDIFQKCFLGCLEDRGEACNRVDLWATFECIRLSQVMLLDSLLRVVCSSGISNFSPFF